MYKGCIKEAEPSLSELISLTSSACRLKFSKCWRGAPAA